MKEIKTYSRASIADKRVENFMLMVLEGPKLSKFFFKIPSYKAHIKKFKTTGRAPAHEALTSDISDSPLYQTKAIGYLWRFNVLGSYPNPFLWFPASQRIYNLINDPTTHLTLQDISFNFLLDPTTKIIDIKALKTDPFKEGCTVALGAAEHS